ncbi:MAG: DUF1146 domain-containing protein [Erysipelotrichaceae bacterium]|nr:DUF1146 domain-containing protein [Erysipelotrichaceae bacterium]MBR5754704.1 DUF1146 domain-containing protein [Erysipelotrichaceae bacterium]
MFDFYVKTGIYLFCFILSIYSLNALDFNRFLKQGKTVQGQLLFFILSCVLAYLLGNFFMAIIYRFN